MLVLSSEDFRENPGTLALAAAWVIVFALILLAEWQDPAPAPGPKWEPLPVSTLVSHRFGDMTWREVRQGQPWRLVTATFIHFGLVHLALNTLGLINLGRLVEPWYRTGPFLAICLAIGGLGNLAGGALRQVVAVGGPWLASVASARHLPGAVERFFRGNGPAAPISIHTGGGSTILLGLLTLGAVVGWRSRTRIGAHLSRQMVRLLALTAILGVAMSGLVDNYGHLGGALVGGAIGLFDRPLVRLAEVRWFRALSWAVVTVGFAACLGLAIRDDRAEANYRQGLDAVVGRGRSVETTRLALNRLHALYASVVFRSEAFHNPLREADALALADLFSRGPKVAEPDKVEPARVAAEREEMGRTLDLLDRAPGDLWGEAIAADLARLRVLGRAALDQPPGYEQAYDFVVCWIEAEKVLAADLAHLNARLVDLEATWRKAR